MPEVQTMTPRDRAIDAVEDLLRTFVPDYSGMYDRGLVKAAVDALIAASRTLDG